MRIQDIQQDHNARTRDYWGHFSRHRNLVTAILCRLAQNRPARLGIFGAGNCNDLDLNALGRAYDRIDLIDLDGEALDFALRRQAAPRKNIFVHGGVDLTGVAGRMSQWRPDEPPSSAEVRACTERAAGWTPGVPAGFGVTASSGVLSQLVHGIVSTLGDRHTEFPGLMTAIRSRHLQLLLEATMPGGTVFLGIDVVSSQTCPQILTAKHGELPNILAEAIQNRNFFTGMNPFLLHNLLTTDPGLAPLVATATAGEPWLWNFGSHSYAFVPFIITRNSRVRSPAG